MTQRDLLYNLLKSYLSVSPLSETEDDSIYELTDYLINEGCIVLPCQTGDILYVLSETAANTITLYKVTATLNYIISNIEKFGTEIFTDKESAINYIEENWSTT